ncbi:MAG: ThiF family adenylyltransferase [Prevotella sp.]|nr:ThiF family adenylyltransferase [Prevotella sp.]
MSGFRQDQVNAAHVMVVGCGALGNEVLKNLVLMGVTHIVAVDFDVVETGNLTRSILFTKEDAERHRRKVDVVEERLKQINPAIEIKTIFGDISFDVGLGLIRKMDVIIGCVDSRWARYCINRLAMRAGVPWVDGGIDNLEGTARVFAPGKNCYACNLGPEGLKELSQRMPCSGIIRRQEQAGSAPTTSIIASVIGAIQVQEALKLVQKDFGTSLCGRMLYYEGEHMTVHTADYRAYDDDCPEHDLWTPVKATNVDATMSVKEALSHWYEELETEDVTLCLTNDCFVDYVSRRDNDVRTYVMQPGRLVEEYIEQDGSLKGLQSNALYQHEYHHINIDFPYPELTLTQLGIPKDDILHAVADGQDFFLELNNR